MHVGQDEPFPREKQQRGERLLLAESALARGMATSTSGLYLTGMALALGANELQYGKLAGAVFVGGSLQLLVVPLLHRLGSRRRFCLVGLGTTRLLRFALAASPLLAFWGMTPAGLMWVMFFLLMCSAITGTASETARQSWLTDLIPGSRLGRFLGWRSAVMRCAGIVATLVYSQFIEFWRHDGHAPVTGFQWLIVFGTGLGLLGLLCISKTPEPPMSERLSPGAHWAAISLPFRDERFRPFMFFICMWMFSLAIAGMFFHMYMLEYLQLRHRPMGYVWVAATDIVSMLLGMVAAPMWGRLADRWGTKRMLLRVGFVMAIFPLLWIPITPELWPLIFVVILLRVCGSGVEIGPMTLALQMAPERRRSVYVAVYRSLACAMMAIAPMVGGAIAHAAGPSFWRLGSFSFTGLHLLFIIASVGRFVSLLWLRRIK